VLPYLPAVGKRSLIRVVVAPLLVGTAIGAILSYSLPLRAQQSRAVSVAVLNRAAGPHLVAWWLGPSFGGRKAQLSIGGSGRAISVSYGSLTVTTHSRRDHAYAREIARWTPTGETELGPADYLSTEQGEDAAAQVAVTLADGEALTVALSHDSAYSDFLAVIHSLRPGR